MSLLDAYNQLFEDIMESHEKLQEKLKNIEELNEKEYNYVILKIQQLDLNGLANNMKTLENEIIDQDLNKLYDEEQKYLEMRNKIMANHIPLIMNEMLTF